MSVKILSHDITSYDLLKTFAVVTMIIDHIGYYFYPDVFWFRSIGRMSFPVWFFLAGYARTREIPVKFLIGGTFLLLLNGVVGMGFLPLNAIFSVLILRVTIDHIMERAKAAPPYLWGVFGICVLLFLPSNALFEYGTVAVLFAMFGYMVRHQGEGGLAKSLTQNFMIGITLVFILYQSVIFGFDTANFWIMAVGASIVCVALSSFRPATFPRLTEKLPTLGGVIRFCGRRTLEIYVVHLTIFKIAALTLGYENFELFRMKLFTW